MKKLKGAQHSIIRNNMSTTTRRGVAPLPLCVCRVCLVVYVLSCASCLTFRRRSISTSRSANFTSVSSNFAVAAAMAAVG